MEPGCRLLDAGREKVSLCAGALRVLFAKVAEFPANFCYRVAADILKERAVAECCPLPQFAGMSSRLIASMIALAALVAAGCSAGNSGYGSSTYDSGYGSTTADGGSAAVA